MVIGLPFHSGGLVGKKLNEEAKMIIDKRSTEERRTRIAINFGLRLYPKLHNDSLNKRAFTEL